VKDLKSMTGHCCSGLTPVPTNWLMDLMTLIQSDFSLQNLLKFEEVCNAEMSHSLLSCYCIPCVKGGKTMYFDSSDKVLMLYLAKSPQTLWLKFVA